MRRLRRQYGIRRRINDTMEQAIIDYKTVEYTGRLGVANHMGDMSKAKKLAQTLLVLNRLQARAANQKVLQAREALRQLEREKKKLEETGVSIPLVEPRLDRLRENLKTADAELANAGEAISCMLDFWQSVGATLEDLCNLCNRNYEQVVKEIKPERVDREFSSLIFVYNLDYKGPRDIGWLEDEVDAPLTHAVKAYYLDLMINTPEGRAASHRAMEECFPGIMEGTLMEVTDADGVRHLIDKDGVEIATLDGEEKD